MPHPILGGKRTPTYKYPILELLTIHYQHVRQLSPSPSPSLTMAYQRRAS